MLTTNGHGSKSEATERVALYMRVSSEEQRERASIRTQEAFLDQYCKLYGFEVAGVYKDDGVSGTVPAPEREGGRRLLEDAGAGKFESVIVYKLDRVGRKLVVVVDAHDRLEEAGVALRSATEPIDTSSPAGRLIFQMLASFAEFERSTIAERVRDGVRRSFKAGRRVGNIPYGYDISAGGAFVVVEEEAARVREVFANIAGGSTLYREAARLNALGVPSPGRRYRGKVRQHGESWGHATIRNIIRQEAYGGTHVVYTAAGPVEREVPRVVSPELQQAAIARLDENKRYSGGRPKNKYLLRGIIRCACCDVNYTGFPGKVPGGKKKTEYTYVRYACPRWRERVKRGWLELNCPTVPALWLEQLAWEDIKRFAQNPGDLLERAAQQMAEKMQMRGDLEERQASLTKRLAQTRKEKSRYVKLYAQGDLDEEELEVYLADLRNRIANLELLIGSVEADLARKEQDQMAAKSASTLLTTLKENLAELEKDTEEAWRGRREVVKHLIKEISVGRTDDGRAKVDIIYTFELPEPVEKSCAPWVTLSGLGTGRKTYSTSTREEEV